MNVARAGSARVCELVCCGKVGWVGATLSALVFWNESNLTFKWCVVGACGFPCRAPKKFLSLRDKNALICRFSKIGVFLGLFGAVRALAKRSANSHDFERLNNQNRGTTASRAETFDGNKY